MMVDTEALVIVDVVRRAPSQTDDEAPFRDIVEDRQLPARRIGWCSAVCTTAKPILLWRVEVANAPATLIGST
jgi:hypothetical protein